MPPVTESQVKKVFDDANAASSPDASRAILVVGLTPLFNQNSGGGGGGSSPSWTSLVDVPKSIETLSGLATEGTLYLDSEGAVVSYPTTAFAKQIAAAADANAALIVLGAEKALGNPASDGRVLSSTAAGVRSWVMASGHSHAISDVTLLQSTLDDKLSISSSRAANTVYAAPSGSAGAPSFRLLVAADIPNHDAAKLTSGILGYARGGTGISEPGATPGNLRWNGSSYVVDTSSYALASAIPAASSTIPASLGSAAIGTGTTWARADHVHAMPTAAQIGAQAVLTNPVTGTATAGQLAIWNGSTTQYGSSRITTDGSSLTLYDGSDSGDYPLLTFNTARPWAFRNSGAGGSSELLLASTIDNKDFQVGLYLSSTFYPIAKFRASSSGGSTTFYGTAIFDYSTASTVPYFNSSKQLVSSSVSPTELGYLSGVTSAIQTQLNGKQALLTNPVTGSASTGQFALWNGSTTQVGSSFVTYDIANGSYRFGGSNGGSSYPGRGVYINGVGSGYRSPRIDLREGDSLTQWSIENYFGAFRFVVGYNATPSVIATLDGGGSFAIGEGVSVSPYIRLAAASGGNANILFRTGTANRSLIRWDATADATTIETRNDDGSARNASLMIPRSSSSAVLAGGSDSQSWNFSGNISVFGAINPRSKVDFSTNWTNSSYRNYMEFRVGSFHWCNDSGGNIMGTAWRGSSTYTTAAPVIQLTQYIGYLGYSTTSSGTGTVTYPYLTWDSTGLAGTFGNLSVPGITFGGSSITLNPNGTTVIGVSGSFTLPIPSAGAVVIAYVSSQPSSNIVAYTTSGYFIEYISSGATTTSVDGSTGVSFNRSAAIFVGVSTYGGSPRWRMIW